MRLNLGIRKISKVHQVYRRRDKQIETTNSNEKCKIVIVKSEMNNKQNCNSTSNTNDMLIIVAIFDWTALTLRLLRAVIFYQIFLLIVVVVAAAAAVDGVAVKLWRCTKSMFSIVAVCIPFVFAIIECRPRLSLTEWEAKRLLIGLK